jgi:hypothetical protein
MNAALIKNIETDMNVAASAIFGGAVSFAVYRWLGAGFPQPQLAAYMAAGGLVAFLACNRSLTAAARREPDFAISIFNVREIEEFELAELFLTDADRLEPSELLLTYADRMESVDSDGELVLTEADRLVPVEEPLVLDDILAQIGPGARVIRMFDPKKMPSPGQLKSRIDSHLEQRTSPSQPTDASQALSEALAELRRSLR